MHHVTSDILCQTLEAGITAAGTSLTHLSNHCSAEGQQMQQNHGVSPRLVPDFDGNALDPSPQSTA